MAPNVVDSNTVDSAEIAAHIAIEAHKFAPLTDGLFATPLPREKEQKKFCQRDTGICWDWSEDDRECKELDKESLRQSIVEEEEIRQMLKVDNIVNNLVKNADDANAKSDMQYVTAEHTQESYWDEPNEEVVDSDDASSHVDEFAVTQLEKGLRRDARRRRCAASQDLHTNSHVGNESHNLANYWFWPANQSEKHTALRDQRILVARDIVEREQIRKMLSVSTVEASLIREAEERRKKKQEQVEGACDDSYWAWSDKSVKASHDPSSWDSYWDFDATDRDAIVHEILRHEDARQAVGVERIESNLLREAKDRKEAKTEDKTGCSDDNYWSWSDDHEVKSSHDPCSSSAYWNFGATEKDVVVHDILAHEEARRAVEVCRLEEHLVQEAKDRKNVCVTVSCAESSGTEGYWDW